MSEYLKNIKTPLDLRNLSIEQLSELADEIRRLIIETVSVTGGHLASNLGVVELTIALHYVFDLDTDHLLWDVGHQCYTHKILTGRKDDFHLLRQQDGISGFPSPQESPYDSFEVGHTGTSISTALGIGMAAKHLKKNDKIISLVGDASIVNGASFEALNNLQRLKRQLLVVLNDNSMAIDVTQGAIAKMLSKIRLSHTYDEINRTTSNVIEHVHLIGKKFENAIENFKKTIRMSLPASRLFESLNIAYFGPVDGHDIGSLIELFTALKDLDRPAVLHVYTKKGKGFSPADADPCKYHSTGPFALDGKTAQPAKKAPTKSFTQAFSDAIVEVSKKHDNVVAITAAMSDGTGLREFKNLFPDRFYDVGIAESVAVDIAAGQAKMGLKPIVCIYSTFLQRSFDQIAHEVSLQNLPVIFCIDRAGLVGDDGPTHHGMLDIGYIRCLPNMVVISPATAGEMESALEFAVNHNGPVAIRYPRDHVPMESKELAACNTPFELGKSVTLLNHEPDINLVALGTTLQAALDAAETLETENINVGVINARFAKPIDDHLIDLLKKGKTLITLEDHSETCGFGSALLEKAAQIDDNNKQVYISQIKVLAGPDSFIKKASRQAQLDQLGLSKEKLVQTVKDIIARRQGNGTINL